MRERHYGDLLGHTLTKIRERNVSTAQALKKLLDTVDLTKYFFFVRRVNFSVFSHCDYGSYFMQGYSSYQ